MTKKYDINQQNLFISYFLQKTIDKLKVIGYTVIELRKGNKIRKIKTKGE